MTWTYTEDYYKKYTHDTWNESAVAYGPVRAVLDLFTPALLAHAAPQRGERALDVATGPGEPALSVAPLVGPTGRVLGIDLAERMIEIARAEAKRRGVANADFQVMDAEKLDVPAGSFDLVTSRFGFQIVTDPDAAIAEAHKALRPGGRIAATVWANPGEKSWFIHALIEPMLSFAEPDETGYLPTPYEMGGPGELAAVLRKHGFRDAREESVRHETVWPDEQTYLDAILKGTPIGHSLSEEDADVQRQVLEKARAHLARFRTPRGIVLSAEAVVVSARK
jgi:ubiquinone/menaquinone biosynthesis C-methylase UbiE